MSHVTDVARYDKGRVTKALITDEGFLKADAVVTRTGVFEYLNKDGSIRYELRHPDDVLKSDSLETLKMIPVTNGHPKTLVNSENAKQLAVGQTGETIVSDAPYVISSLKITDQNTISDIKSGRRKELSLGYLVDLVQEDGVYNGQPFTHKQTNIRYNHLAVVEVARAGSAARINLDENDAVQSDSNFNNAKFKERIMPDTESKLPTITLDGIEYRSSQEVINAYKKVLVKSDEAQVKLDSTVAELERLKAERDSLKEKLDEASKVDIDAKVAEGVKVRVTLIEDAKSVMGNQFEELKLDTLANAEILKAVVKAKCENLNVDEKSNDYIQARFDMLTESAKSEPSEGFKKQVEKSSTQMDSASANDPAAASKRMQKDTLNAWKTNPFAQAK